MIVTKLWISDYGHAEALVGFNGCLRRLGVDYVDLFLLHQPVPTEFDRTIGAHQAIEEMLAAGASAPSTNRHRFRQPAIVARFGYGVEEGAAGVERVRAATSSGRTSPCGLLPQAY